MMRRLSTWLAMAAMLAGTPACAADPRPLEQDVLQAAITCTYATVMVNSVNGRIDARGMADAAWYGYAGVLAKSDGRPYSKQSAELADRNPPDPDIVKANARSVVEACQRRWPRSKRGATRIVLPTGKFDRALFCYAVASQIHNLSEGEIQLYGASAMEAPLKRYVDTLTPMFDDATLAKHGIVGGQGFYKAVSDLQAKATTLGNFNDAVDTCMAS